MLEPEHGGVELLAVAEGAAEGLGVVECKGAADGAGLAAEFIELSADRDEVIVDEREVADEGADAHGLVGDGASGREAGEQDGCHDAGDEGATRNQACPWQPSLTIWRKAE